MLDSFIAHPWVQSFKEEFTARVEIDYTFVDPKRLARWDLVKWSEFTGDMWVVPLISLSLYIFMLIFQGRIRKVFGGFRPKFVALWNISLSIFSLVGAIVTITSLLTGPSGILNKGWHESVCGEPQYGFGFTGLFVFLFVYSKLFELFDTYWQFVGDRNVSCLHWYHHITVVLFCWHSYSVRTSIGLWFIAMNYATHALMYHYFFFSQVGGWFYEKLQRYKIIITILQTLQMFVGMIVSVYAFAMYHQGCKANRLNAVFGALMYTTYFVLFMQQIIRKNFPVRPPVEIFDVEKLHYKMAPDATPLRSWTLRDIDMPKVIYFTIIHSGAFYGLHLLYNGYVGWKTMLLAVIFHHIGGLGVTAGLHRLWTHRSYDVTFPLELFLAFCATVANQGSIWHWSRDHVVHHKYSESVADPHDARRGFFFAHIGWLLVKKQPEVALAGKQFQYPWLRKNRMLMQQHKFYFPLAILCCFMLPTYIATYWDDFDGGLYVAGFLRYAFTLHCTWCVNSFAHLHGDRPYDKSINPAENLMVSILAMGEGWHNYHHTYPRDYSTSEFGISKQWNPTRLFIDCCAKFGLAYNLNKHKFKKEHDE